MGMTTEEHAQMEAEMMAEELVQRPLGMMVEEQQGQRVVVANNLTHNSKSIHCQKFYSLIYMIDCLCC
jgi:hypothetical protein